MNRCIKLFILMLLPLMLAAAEFSDYTTLINQKMETERRLEKHIGGIVTKIVGERKSTVIVNVELSDMIKTRVQTEQWLEKEKERGKTAAPPKKEEFLPGIPLKSKIQEKDVKEGSPGKSGAKEIRDILTLPAKFIKSIKINLILDKSVAEATEATLKNIINDILDLNPGDIVITRVNFAGRSVDFLGFLFNPYFYVIILVIITLLILGLFLFGPLRSFLFATLQTLKDLKGIKSEAEYTGAGGGGGGVFGGVSAGTGEGRLGIEEEEEKKEKEELKKTSYKPLKFLEDKDLKKLAYLLNFEKPEVATLIINYLEPEKAVKVLETMPIDEKQKAQIVKGLIKMQRTSREVIQHIDDFLSKNIDYVAGGIDKLLSVLEVMSEEEREKLLNTISEEDAEFSEKVKNKIFSFDKIVDLDEAAVQMLIQEVETRDLGIALKNAAEEIRQKFTSNMSEGAAALLKEEIEFGKKVTESQIKAKQVEIIAKIKHLESEGLISALAGAGTDELWKEEIGEEEKEGVFKDIIKAAQQALKKKEVVSAAEGGEQDETAFKYYEQGLEAYKEENYEEAIKHFNQSIEYNPGVWQAYQYVGSCYLALGEEDNAKEAYQRSLELNPENSELREWVETH